MKKLYKREGSISGAQLIDAKDTYDICPWELRRCEKGIFSEAEYDQIIKTFEPKKTNCVSRTRYRAGLTKISIDTEKTSLEIEKFGEYFIMEKTFSNRPDRIVEIYKA